MPKFRSKRKLHSHFPEKSENTFGPYLEPLKIEGPTMENTKICVETPLKSLVDCRAAHNGGGLGGGWVGGGVRLSIESLKKLSKNFHSFP